MNSVRKPLEEYLALEYPFVVMADPDGGYVVSVLSRGDAQARVEERLAALEERLAAIDERLRLRTVG